MRTVVPYAGSAAISAVALSAMAIDSCWLLWPVHRSTSPTSTSVSTSGAEPAVEKLTLNGAAVAASGGTAARHTPSAPVVASGTGGQPLQPKKAVDTVAPGAAKPHSEDSGESRCRTIDEPTVLEREKGAAAATAQSNEVDTIAVMVQWRSGSAGVLLFAESETSLAGDFRVVPEKPSCAQCCYVTTLRN